MAKGRVPEVSGVRPFAVNHVELRHYGEIP
jgi:hypothetical protein